MDNIYILNKERSVLSTLIDAHINNFNLEKAFMSGLTFDMFYLPAHQKLFELIYTYYKVGKAYTIDNIRNDINSKEVSDSIIVEVVSSLTLTETLFYADIEAIKENYQKRKYAELASHVKKLIAEENATSDTLKTYIENSIHNLSFVSNNGYTRNLSEVRKDRKSKPPAQRIPTGIPFIDTVLTDKDGKVGIRNEGLFFISGLKQAGKTYILKRIIENVSKTAPVLFGTLEFGEDLYDEDIEEAQKDGEFEGNIENIYTFDSVYDIDRIMSEIRYQVKVNGIKLAALDSMMRMTNLDPNLKTDERRISDMFSKLGKLSKELKIPIIIIVQSSKEDLKSSIISVKGSMNADHEAYVWFHIYKTDTKNPQDERRTVIWNKNKDTHKHPKQYLMFVPQTKDFYQFEANEQGYPARALHKYRQPKYQVPEANYSKEPEITNYKNTEAEDEKIQVEMPEFDF